MVIRSTLSNLSVIPLVHPVGERQGVRGYSLPALNSQLSTLNSLSVHRRRQCGALLVELLVAMALLIGVLFPLAYSFATERRLARSYYQRAVAIEIVDGEMETLMAGEWHAFPTGTHDYAVHAGAATNLPPGRFTLTVQPPKLRLRWQPTLKDRGGPVTREAILK
jgi:hypothetical protein